MRLLFQGDPSHRDLDTYGGLELRFSVNWAHYIEQNGHQVYFLGADQVVSSAKNYDFVFDAPTWTSLPCPDHPHFHSYFSPGAPECLKGHCAWPILHPSVDGYKMGVALDEGIPRMFAPIPYPNSFLPTEMQEPFDRKLILWANKGSFTPGFGRQQSSMEHLRALAKLAKEFEFKVLFGGDAFIDAEPFKDEIGALLAIIPHALMGRIPWTELVRLSAQTKLSLHPGGITGCVYESVFAKSLPLVPPGFWAFQEALKDTKLLSSPFADEAEVEEVLRHFWTDKEYYYKIHAIIQEDFEVNRNPQKQWKELEAFMLDHSSRSGV